MPQVVPKECLQNAITWNSTSWQIAAVAGPAVGGLVIARTGGAGWAYVTTAALTLLSDRADRLAPDEARSSS